MEKENIITEEEETKINNFGSIPYKIFLESFKTYSSFNNFLKILLGFLNIPSILLSTTFLILFYIVFFIYKIIITPINYLEKVIKEYKNEHPAPKTVIYLIGFPYIFSGHILCSILLIPMVVLNFLLNIFCYLNSIGRLKIQPFLLETKDIKINKDKKIKFCNVLLVILFFVSTFLILFVIGNDGC